MYRRLDCERAVATVALGRRRKQAFLKYINVEPAILVVIQKGDSAAEGLGIPVQSAFPILEALMQAALFGEVDVLVMSRRCRAPNVLACLKGGEVETREDLRGPRDPRRSPLLFKPLDARRGPGIVGLRSKSEPCSGQGVDIPARRLGDVREHEIIRGHAEIGRFPQELIITQRGTIDVTLHLEPACDLR
jgi:hypothetical protein